MDNEKTIQLYFDKYIFPVTYDWMKTFIRDEMERLANETGYSIDKLYLQFKDNPASKAVAYFERCGDEPLGFCFFLNHFDKSSTNEIIDTCRHEFAHYIVCMQNAGHHPENAHGTKWKDVCGDVGCRPLPSMSGERTKHFV